MSYGAGCCTCFQGHAPCSWCTRPLCSECGADIAIDTEHWENPLCQKHFEDKTEFVPHGKYCYEPYGVVATGNGSYELQKRVCPYWGWTDALPRHENGICRLMPLNDWESEDLSFLWDQVKACGVNEP